MRAVPSLHFGRYCHCHHHIRHKKELLRAESCCRHWQVTKRLQRLLGNIVQAQEMFELKFSFMLPSLFSAVGRLCASSVVARLFRLGCRVDNQPVAFFRKPRLPCCVSSSRAVLRLFSRGCRVVSLTVLAARTPTIARPDKVLPIYCRELLAVLRSPERLLFRACHICCSCLNGAQPGCSLWLDPHCHHTLLLRIQPSLMNVVTHICSSCHLRCRRCCRPRRCPCCSCCCPAA